MFKNFLLHQISDNPIWQKIGRERIALRDINYEFWLKNNLFSFVWWLMALLIVILWIIWWKLVDKTRLTEIAVYGLMIGLAATLMDVVGVAFVLWGYPQMLLPLVPPVFSVTVYGLLPIAFMLTYQYFRDWKSFIKATVVVAAVLAFIAEPISVWLGILDLPKWKHQYSFLTNIGIPVLLKFVMNKILEKQNAR